MSEGQRFIQPADTFFRDLSWTSSGGTISVDQVLGGDRYVVVLSR